MNDNMNYVPNVLTFEIQDGADKLCEALTSSQFLTELDLSFNSLGDKGLQNLQAGFCESPSLRVLNISHNELTEESADILEKILTENKALQELDLSWNSFCTPLGNKKLFNAMKVNDSLRVLNIAWNGISLKAAVTPLTNYMKNSENLEYLDLSSNRLDDTSLRVLRTGILKNHSLISVKVANNYCLPEDALFFASVLPLKVQDPLRHLDMENIVFEKKVLPLLVRIKNAGKTIKIGNILGNYTINGPDIIKLLFQRCRYILEKPKKVKLKKDFGHFVLALPDEPISKVQFSALLKKKKIKKLDENLIKELCGRFTLRNQNIDCVEMKKVYMKYYPDTVLPPVPPKKKKAGGKKGKGKGKKGESAEPVQEEVATQKQVSTVTTEFTESQLETEAPQVEQIVEGETPQEEQMAEGETPQEELTILGDNDHKCAVPVRTESDTEVEAAPEENATLEELPPEAITEVDATEVKEAFNTEVIQEEEVVEAITEIVKE